MNDKTIYNRLKKIGKEDFYNEYIDFQYTNRITKYKLEQNQSLNLTNKLKYNSQVINPRTAQRRLGGVPVLRYVCELGPEPIKKASSTKKYDINQQVFQILLKKYPRHLIHQQAPINSFGTVQSRYDFVIYNNEGKREAAIEVFSTDEMNFEKTYNIRQSKYWYKHDHNNYPLYFIHNLDQPIKGELTRPNWLHFNIESFKKFML